MEEQCSRKTCHHHIYEEVVCVERARAGGHRAVDVRAASSPRRAMGTGIAYSIITFYEYQLLLYRQRQRHATDMRTVLFTIEFSRYI